MSKMDSISTDAAFSAGPSEIIISKDTIIRNNIGIRELHLDDLFYLEKDLEFYEKVF